MLKNRIIPVLLWGDHGLTKPVQFKRPGRFVGSLMSAAMLFEKRTCDELILLDIDATPKKRGPRFEEIKQFTSELFCPVTIGGGITTLSDIRDMLASGADKVVLRSNVKETFIREAAAKFGSQAISIAMDYKAIDVFSLPYLAARFQSWGAGEIILTSMERDGTRTGYDIEGIQRVTKEVSIPVVANGGCSGALNMIDAFRAGAHAVAASSIFLYDDITPADCKVTLDRVGIPVRIEEPDADAIEAFGETKSIADWYHDPRCKCSLGVLQSRLRRGIAPEIAIAERIVVERKLV